MLTAGARRAGWLVCSSPPRVADSIAFALKQPMITIARLVRSAAWLVAAVIVAGIVLVLLDANMGNVIVRDIHDAASFLVGPFKNVFSPKSHKVDVAVNWGLAAVVYLLVGSLIARLLVRMAPRGVVRSRTAAV